MCSSVVTREQPVGGPPVVVAAEAPAVVGAVDGGVDGVVLPGP